MSDLDKLTEKYHNLASDTYYLKLLIHESGMVSRMKCPDAAKNTERILYRGTDRLKLD